jgi:hypothetical protein
MSLSGFQTLCGCKTFHRFDAESAAQAVVPIVCTLLAVLQRYLLCLCVFGTCQPDKIAVCDQIFAVFAVADFIAFVAQTFFHFHEKIGGINQLHFILPRFGLAVTDNPDVGEDACVVKHLVRQGDNSFQIVIFNNPAADLLSPLPAAPVYITRAVKDDGNTRAFSALCGCGVHFGHHVQQEQ